MQALSQPPRLVFKASAKQKTGPARHGKPVLSFPRGAVQSQAAVSGSGWPAVAPLYQLADAEEVVGTDVPLVLDAVVDGPPPAALEAAAAARSALAAATDAVSAAADAVADAADAAVEAVSSTAVAASEAIADSVTAMATATAASPAATPAPTTLSLAAQRYAEMTSKAPKVAPGGGGGTGFQAPSFSPPDFSSVQLPKFTAPDLSNLSAPKLSAPDFSKLSVPELPKLPSVNISGGDGSGGGDGVALPRIDFSKLELPVAPTFDVPDIGGAVSNVTAAIGSGAADVTAAVAAAAGNAAATINDATGGLLDELDRDLGAIQRVVQSTTASVESAVGDAVSSVEASFGSTVGQAYDALPPQAQLIVRDLGDVGYAFASHPTSSLVLVGLVGLPLGIKIYVDRYGGYSGDLSPAVVKEMLSKDDVLVVDVRTEAERQELGVLELRKSARFSAAALPVDLVTFPPKWARESKAGERLGTNTAALLISRLNRIRTPLTKVVIMNNNDDLAARDLARAVRAAGVLRVYVMAGGFQAWSAAGLGVVAGKADYDASALVVLLDEIAEMAAVVGPKLREPAFLATTLATSSIAVYAAVNYHTTLRYFAVWGIFATIYQRLSRYESPQEFLEDIKSGALAAASTAAGAAGAVARAATSKPPVLPPAAAAATSLPATVPAAAAPAAPLPPPPSPPTEASPAALAAAMAAAGVAPQPPLPAAEAPSSSAAATAQVEAEAPTSIPAPIAAAGVAPQPPLPAAKAPSSSAAATAQVEAEAPTSIPAPIAALEPSASPADVLPSPPAPAPALVLPMAAAAVSETTTSAPAAAAAIAAAVAAAASPPPPVVPTTNGNGNGNGASKAAKATVVAMAEAEEAAKLPVPVSAVEAAARTAASGETSGSE